MVEMEYTNKSIGGSYGSRQVRYNGRLWIYKSTRPRSEVAAYQIYEVIKPLLKGHWYVPFTTFAPDGNSLQYWVEDATPFTSLCRYDVYEKPKFIIDPITAAECQAFDYLIQNSDRHHGNFLIDLAGQVALIDHGNAFAGYLNTAFRTQIDDSTVVDWSPAIKDIERVWPSNNSDWVAHGPTVVSTRIDKLASSPVKKVAI